MGMLNLSFFQELFDLGFLPLPIIWDTQKKIASKHPERDQEITPAYVTRLLEDGFNSANALAFQVLPPNMFLDFDLKNTANKKVYGDWVQMVRAVNEDIFSKMCIERTRNGGYHVHFKYAKASTKLTVARSATGQEIVSAYTGGLLCYSYPTPGYEVIHGDFNDVDYLTDEEFDLILSCAAYFNEETGSKEYDPTLQLIEYPAEYENVCLQFDAKCTDDAFEKILNGIGLFRIPNARQWDKKKFIPFLRAGSTAAYSAKAYFKAKRLLIFSGSMPGYPTWHDSAKSGNWSLSPSKILFYKNGRAWGPTMDEIKHYDKECNIGISYISDTPLQKANVTDTRLHFPYDVFPEPIHEFIRCQVIQHEFLAGGILAAVSTMIGNSARLEAMPGYLIKPILYMAVVSPPGGSKTPGLKKAFSPIMEVDDLVYKEHELELQTYNEALTKWENSKRTEPKPEKPESTQLIINDATIEMVAKILAANKVGCCLFNDELSGFLNRMNQYKDGDEVQKWLSLWNGGDTLRIQRITRDETRASDPFCSIVGGIPAGILAQIAKGENESNGFFHRFLYVYPETQNKPDWNPHYLSPGVKEEYFSIFHVLKDMRSRDWVTYKLTDEANAMYADWFNRKNRKYDATHNDHHKGIIAKYQDYCLRFALLFQVLYDGYRRQGLVYQDNMERAIRVTEYFFANMYKALKILVPESHVDRLQKPYDEFYNRLPQAFAIKTAVELGTSYKLADRTVRMFISRHLKTLFAQIDRGQYEKLL